MLPIRIALLTLAVGISAAFSPFQSLFEGEEVRALLSASNQLFASTKSGLFTIESETKSQIPMAIEDDIITTMVEADKENIYAGTFDGKLISISKDKKVEIKNLPKVGEFETYYLVDLAYKNGFVWIGTLEGVVFRYSTETKSFDHYDLKTFNRQAFLNIIQIAIDNDDNIWVCSQDRIYFLTTLFSPKKEKNYEFLGSSTYDNMRAQFVEHGDDGVFVVSTSEKINSLSYGNLNRSFLDATKSKIELPIAVQSGNIKGFDRVSDKELWLLHDKLYKYDGTNWTSFEVEGIGKDVYDLVVNKNTIWIASSNGLKSLKVKE